jgi:hypothetical protein
MVMNAKIARADLIEIRPDRLLEQGGGVREQ